MTEIGEVSVRKRRSRHEIKRLVKEFETKGSGLNIKSASTYIPLRRTCATGWRPGASRFPANVSRSTAEAFFSSSLDSRSRSLRILHLSAFLKTSQLGFSSTRDDLSPSEFILEKGNHLVEIHPRPCRSLPQPNPVGPRSAKPPQEQDALPPPPCRRNRPLPSASARLAFLSDPAHLRAVLD